MERFDIFPTPIWSVSYLDAENFRKETVPFLLEYEQKFPMNIEYSLNGYTSYGREVSDILQFEELSFLKNFVLDSARMASSQTGIEGEHFITDSWFNINRKGSYHGMHNHVPDIWSGIYYVQAEESDARICFYDLNKTSNWPWRPVEGKFGAMRMFTPKTGRLYLFPSYIMHEVEQQTSEGERISISFNIGVN